LQTRPGPHANPQSEAVLQDIRVDSGMAPTTPLLERNGHLNETKRQLLSLDEACADTCFERCKTDQFRDPTVQVGQASIEGDNAILKSCLRCFCPGLRAIDPFRYSNGWIVDLDISIERTTRPIILPKASDVELTRNDSCSSSICLSRRKTRQRSFLDCFITQKRDTARSRPA
jgi:hypothetical protein